MKNSLTTLLLLLSLAAGAATMNVDLPQSGSLGSTTTAPNTYVGRFYGNGAGLTNLIGLGSLTNIGLSSVGPASFLNTNIFWISGYTNQSVLTNTFGSYPSNCLCLEFGKTATGSNVVNGLWYWNPTFHTGNIGPGAYTNECTYNDRVIYFDGSHWTVPIGGGLTTTTNLQSGAGGWAYQSNMLSGFATNYLFYGDGSQLTNLSMTTTGLVGKILASQIESNAWYLATNSPALNRSNAWVGTFTGNGAGLTNLPASGVTNNQGNVTLAGAFTGNGAGLTNIPAKAIPGGALTNGQSNVTLNGTFNGSGAGLSSIPAASVGSGGAVTNNQTGVTLAGTFTGNGQNLTDTAGARLAGLDDVTNVIRFQFAYSNKYVGTFVGSGAGLTNVAGSGLARAGMFYLDSTNGSDSAGVKGLRESPYKTFQAIWPLWTNHDTVILSPGFYPLPYDMTNCPNGLNIYGAGIFSSVIDPTMGITVCGSNGVFQDFSMGSLWTPEDLGRPILSNFTMRSVQAIGPIDGILLTRWQSINCWNCTMGSVWDCFVDQQWAFGGGAASANAVANLYNCTLVGDDTSTVGAGQVGACCIPGTNTYNFFNCNYIAKHKGAGAGNESYVFETQSGIGQPTNGVVNIYGGSFLYTNRQAGQKAWILYNPASNRFNWFGVILSTNSNCFYDPSGYGTNFSRCYRVNE